ncbi:hypothetical protein B5F83_06955 [Muribaculum sp. An289]|jgi:acyl carrier protein|uniref:Acyl carrier protein n=1 Tax=Candidatus Merdivivens faecigallinarum TaxID=2840871 RepID=A0A9D9J0T6_9BACT|nr:MULTISPECIES: phosphopantetheine-binding protein [unclassified Muribaculum]MBO8482145.1 acyl carrier protein [Candidatus Merdivivens faecigallinarum]OUO36774.1 hypothetical protein B5F83_06955 [Muribaculum sp. An289]OUO42681.1 hypothetical protein B5F81_06440 [Muribaculum sp. An287]
MSKIFTIVRNIIADHAGISPESLEPSTQLEAIGLDGMDISEVFMSIEDEFDVEISDEEYNDIRTINDIEELIRKKR